MDQDLDTIEPMTRPLPGLDISLCHMGGLSCGDQWDLLPPISVRPLKWEQIVPDWDCALPQQSTDDYVVL